MKKIFHHRLPTIPMLALTLSLLASLVLFVPPKNLPLGGQVLSLTQDAAENTPSENIQIANITDTQATLLWQTINPVVGKVVYSQSENLTHLKSDDRDKDTPAKRYTHFVTLTNLNPDTKYFFKIQNGSTRSPQKPLEFQTAAKNLSTPNKPVIGKILDTNLLPIDEALIYLKLPQSTTQGAHTSTSGNFVLSLVNLAKSDLSQEISILPNTQASLIIRKANLVSNIKITLPQDNNLPPIILGQDFDFSGQDIQQIDPDIDLNNDGTINSLDLARLSEIISQSSKKAFEPTFKGPTKEEKNKADVNKDGLLNQTDLEIFKRYLQN